MVAYNFQPRFRKPILEGTKGGTIRGQRRRHARAGDELQLYTGMRTTRCDLIARRTCLSVQPIILEFEVTKVVLGDAVIASPEQLDAFAEFDGFQNYAELVEFWRETHCADGYWTGWHIRWLDLP